MNFEPAAAAAAAEKRMYCRALNLHLDILWEANGIEKIGVNYITSFIEEF